MITTVDEETIILQAFTRRMLHELGFGSHRLGYKQLLILITRYALDSGQSLTKELYPAAAKHFGYRSWKPVEHAVRGAILDAWERGDLTVWDTYFRGMGKPPTSLQFIATIAELVKNAPPG